MLGWEPLGARGGGDMGNPGFRAPALGESETGPAWNILVTRGIRNTKEPSSKAFLCSLSALLSAPDGGRGCSGGSFIY